MFKSINYARITCDMCNAETIILPGEAFSKLTCHCEEDKPRQYKDIQLWTDGKSSIEVLGEFENGDFEVRHADGVLSYRMPHATLIKDFREVVQDIPPPMELKTIEYSELTVPQLKAIAKEMGIEGIARLTKDKLIERITDGED